MTNLLYFIGAYFSLIAGVALFTSASAALPIVMAVYFLANTPISKAIEKPLPWHMTFLGIDLAMMVYCLTFHTLAMNIAAAVFLLSAVFYMAIIFQVQWAARLHTYIASIMVFGILLSVTAHIAIQGAKSAL